MTRPLPAQARTTHGLLDLTPARRRHALFAALAKGVLTFVVVIGLYYVVPLSSRDLRAPVLVRAAVAGLAFLGVLGWQLRGILRAEMPGFRAFQAVVVVVPLFLTGYAATYVLLSDAQGGFTEPLTRTSALYFSVVVFSSVGFGDISPVSDVTRLVVASQMIGDLVLLATVARLFTGASQINRERSEPDRDEASS